MSYKSVLLTLCLLSAVIVPALSAKKATKQDEKEEVKDEVQYIVTEEVYLDVEIENFYGPDNHFGGRIVIGIFGDLVPMTALNFITLAKGFKKRGILYKYGGTSFHRAVTDFMIQGGDVTHNYGEGGMSLYGPMFDDENFVVSHQSAGIVSMANYGRNSNASQFFILLQKSRWLNGRHVAFGKVIKGMDAVRKIGSVKSSLKGTLINKVRIIDSGVVGIPSKYELSAKQMSSDDDVE
ncbi:hypothetical protein SNE40_011223 [Patella caerulea]|uniref:Peptidyl-prolyl cis-trans isomerase n=1 Tax=Patella caerulea TaxID=87958 RepID=A0AAN8JPE4_PATCE